MGVQMKKKVIDIIIPSYNEDNMFLNLKLKILLKNHSKFINKIYLIDDGSLPKVELDPKLLSRITLIRNTKNIGKKRSIINILKQIRSKYVLFLDSDTIIENGSLESLIRFMDFNPLEGACGKVEIFNQVNLLTDLQEIHYELAFKQREKKNICNCGCFAIYKKESLNEKVINNWSSEKINFGEDRALTDFVYLSGGNIGYDKDSLSSTACPNKFYKWFKQQIRWKKSGIWQIKRLFKKNKKTSLKELFKLIINVMSIPIIIWFLPYSLIIFPIFSLYYYLYLKCEFPLTHCGIYTLLKIIIFPLITLISLITINKNNWGTR